MSLHIDGLKAGYGRHVVLSDISLSIETGSICALIGRNGSGKTTLMRCINRIIQPMAGDITFRGNNIANLKRSRIARLIGFVPQSNATAFPFSCMEIILMGCAARLQAWASPSAGEKERAREICRELNIERFADRSFQTLSGGEKQLVLLARAFFQNAPMLLLDEPNSHLDFTHQHETMAMIRRVVEKMEATALITLHDPNLALYYCDQGVVIHDGRVIARGPIAEILSDRLLTRVMGENIIKDKTLRGIPVVTPRQVPFNVEH